MDDYSVFKEEWFVKHCKEQQKKWEEEKRKRAEWESKIPEDQRIGAYWKKVKAEEEARIAKGEIVDLFIKQWLESSITAERWKLLIGILLTALIKGQWVFWIILILIYNYKVNKLQIDALEAQRKKRGYTNERVD